MGAGGLSLWNRPSAGNLCAAATSKRRIVPLSGEGEVRGSGY